jgi:hypothetical protein
MTTVLRSENELPEGWIEDHHEDDATAGEPVPLLIVDPSNATNSREYGFNIEPADSDSADAILAKKWGCLAWGRGGTRNALYGLLPAPTCGPFGEEGVTVARIYEHGVATVQSAKVVEDFLLTCAEIGAGGLQVFNEEGASESRRIAEALTRAAMDSAYKLKSILHLIDDEAVRRDLDEMSSQLYAAADRFNTTSM